jgi:hypothetical protein
LALRCLIYQIVTFQKSAFENLWVKFGVSGKIHRNLSGQSVVICECCLQFIETVLLNNTDFRHDSNETFA